MKYITFLLVIFILNNQHVAAQDSSNHQTKAYYLQKSKAQKTTAWVFLGAGAAAIITGTIVGTSLKEEDSLDEGFDKMTTGGAVILAGGVSCLVSIPFFISSGKNKRRAMALSSGLQQVPLPVNGLTIQQPAISVSWTIGR